MTTITLPRATVEQALEALENLHGARLKSGLTIKTQPIADALRAALAEFEADPQNAVQTQTESKQEPVAWRYRPGPSWPWSLTDDGYYAGCKRDSGYAVEPLYTHPAPQRQSQDEPVAKVELMTTGGNAGLATRIVEIDDHLRERLRPGQMLYTHPVPQRQPLTEEEVDYIWESEKAFPDIYAIVRAIEKAHGIGGQDGQG